MVVVLPIYIYTKFYLEYYFRLLLNVYNMEAINIFKKIIIIILIYYLSPPWQIPNSTTTDPPKKNPRATTDNQHISLQSRVQTKCSPLQILDLLGCTQLLQSPTTIQVFLTTI